MVDPVMVGMIDSGFRAEQAGNVLAARSFRLRDAEVDIGPAQPDRLGHGSCLLDVVAAHAPTVKFIIAQVFHDRMVTSAVLVAAALDWLAERKVRVINLSLGLRQDRGVLRVACERAVADGIVLCASTPARGEPVYPASYPGVMRMTGDARCAFDQFSKLETRYADYGGHVRSALPGVVGASAGSAHMTGHVAAYLTGGGEPRHLKEWLDARAAFIGPEHRTG